MLPSREWQSPWHSSRLVCRGPLSELRMLPLTEADKGTALQQLNSIGFKEHTKRWKRIWATQEQEAY